MSAFPDTQEILIPIKSKYFKIKIKLINKINERLEIAK